MSTLLDAPKPVLVRRGFVSAFETGPRPLPPADALLRWGRPALLHPEQPDLRGHRPAGGGADLRRRSRPEHTPRVLDELTGTPSTFFVLAERAERHPPA